MNVYSVLFVISLTIYHIHEYRYPEQGNIFSTKLLDFGQEKNSIYSIIATEIYMKIGLKMFIIK